MKIAFIAHDKKKDDIIDFVKRYKNIFEGHELFGTGTTAKLISEATGLKIHGFLSGPLGGDQEIGGKVAEGKVDLVFFLRDPLTAQPHEPDVSALLRICDVHSVPLATNLAAAEIFAKVIGMHCVQK